MKGKWIKALLCALLIATFALSPMSALASSTARIFIVNTEGARLRNGENRTNIVASLPKGTRVVYKGKSEGSMYYVRTSAGQSGYIYKEYLSSYGAASSKQVYKVTKRTAMYRKSGGSGHIGSLSKGTTVIVYEVHSKWAYVKTLKGKSGYVRKSALKKA